jgi:hypothetical protein
MRQNSAKVKRNRKLSKCSRSAQQVRCYEQKKQHGQNFLDRRSQNTIKAKQCYCDLARMQADGAKVVKEESRT